jgi:hypothetical protein
MNVDIWNPRSIWNLNDYYMILFIGMVNIMGLLYVVGRHLDRMAGEGM